MDKLNTNGAEKAAAISGGSQLNENGTQRSFRMHPNLLFDVITKQAGTIGKALLEGVMNSIDAGAHSVELTITADGFVLSDDGRGFRSEDEIDRFFATFGTPHCEGDARFGRFRMGRGQMFAFARTNWFTREFVMAVDIKNKGLAFTLTRSTSPVEGCRIEGSFYELLSPTEILAVETEIRRNCLYVDISLKVNGRCVSQDPSKMEWDHVLPDAWITLSSGGTKGIAVYQQGVYVETIPAAEYGLSGTVVTRPGYELKVNFARNQVLRSCPRFRAILSLIGTQQEAKIRRRTELDDSELEALWTAIRRKEVRFEAYEHCRYIQDTTGRCWSYRQLKSHLSSLQRLPDFSVPYSVGRLHDPRADRCMQRNLAFVLSENCFNGLGGDPSTGGLFTREEGLRFVPLDQLTARMKTTYQLVPEDELTKREATIVEALVRASRYFSWESFSLWHSGLRQEKQWIEMGKRTLRIGLSDVARGWTDGKTYIALERRELIGKVDIEFFYSISRILLHEYCHDIETGTAHDHSPHFYRLFHDRSILMGLVANKALHFYRRILAEAGKARQSERLETISEEVQSSNERIVYGENPGTEVAVK